MYLTLGEHGVFTYTVREDNEVQETITAVIHNCTKNIKITYLGQVVVWLFV